MGVYLLVFAQAYEREVENKPRKISQSVAVQVLANQYMTATLTGEPVRRPKGWRYDSGTDSAVHRRTINAAESDVFLSTVSKNTPLQLSGPSGLVRKYAAVLRMRPFPGDSASQSASK